MYNKVICCVAVIFLVPCIARNLISYDEIEQLIGAYMRGEVERRPGGEDARRMESIAELLAMPDHLMRRDLHEFSAPRLTLTCVLCRSVFRALIDAVVAGQTDEQMNTLVVNLCVTLGIESEKVCGGVIALNVPIIVYIIRHNPDVSPNTFCGLLFQTTEVATCPFEDERFEWEVDIPPRSASTPSTVTYESTPLTIALVSDAHIDPLYEPFGAADCGEPTCCRIGQTSEAQTRSSRHIDDDILGRSIYSRGSDVMLDLDVADEIRSIRSSQLRNGTLSSRSSDRAGYWGDYRSCDTPLWAFDDIVDRITSNHKVDVVYYIGDSIDHFVWETTYSVINNVNNYVMNKMQEKFGDVPIFSVIGNHESQPTNQFAPSEVTEPKLETHWLYDGLAELWGRWLPEEGKQTVRRGGYYTALVRPGLRVIGINNNIAYKYNWWLVHDPLDARTHLQWLADALHAAELAGERVHVLAHIPPGVHDLTKTWTREYNRIISRFSSTITAEFNGHTHSDEFKVFYSNSDGSPINVAWNAGSMTSYTYYNLNYKIVTVDADTYVPLNIETYMYNLTEANLTPNQRPHWFQLYDFRDVYGVSDLSAGQIDRLVHRMVTTEKQLLDNYIHFFHKLNDVRRGWGCNDDCKLSRLCLTVVTELWERQKCDEIRALYHT